MFGLDRKIVLKLTFAFAIFLISAIYITYPLIFNMAGLTIGFGDELLIAWIQNFVIHHPFTFNANIFFPYTNTLAYSDLFLISSIISAIPLYILKEPIVAFNFTLITSIALLGFSIFCLSYYLTKDFLSSLIGGLLVVFSPAVMTHTTHVQVLAIYFVPFSILFFFHFLKTIKTKFLILSLLFFVLQTLNSFLPGYFIIFFYATTLFAIFFADRKKLKGIFNKNNLLVFIVSILVLIPVIIPYYQVAKEFNYKRDIRDSIYFALQPEDMLVANSYSKLQQPLSKIFENIKYHDKAEVKHGYIGLIFTLSSIAAIAFLVKKYRKLSLEFKSLFFTGLLGLITALGPALHIGRLTIHQPFPVILPYALFYYILPGFSGFRNSARWEMFFILCFAVLSAMTISYLFKKLSKTIIYMISFILIICIVWEFNPVIYLQKIPQIKNYPAVYKYLVKENKPAIFIPICPWYTSCSQEDFLRIYYSTQGFPVVANGLSGFSPPVWEKWAENIHNNFPYGNTISSIKNKGIVYIVFEKDIYDKYFENKGERVLSELLSNSEPQLIKQYRNTYLFKISY